MRSIRSKRTKIGSATRKALSPINAASSVAGLLVGVSVPYNVIRQAVHCLACTSGHLCKAFCLGLVLEGVRGEINACDLRVSTGLLKIQSGELETNLLCGHQPLQRC